MVKENGESNIQSEIVMKKLFVEGGLFPLYVHSLLYFELELCVSHVENCETVFRAQFSARLRFQKMLVDVRILIPVEMLLYPC